MIQRSFFPDLFILVPTLLLICLGVVIIYSSDPRLAIQQLIFGLIGLGIFWLLSTIDVEAYSQSSTYFYFLILVLLLVVFILGIETRGSLRWIPLGDLRIQPSEFAKPVLVMFLAKFWSNNLTSWRNIGKSLLWTVPFLFLIFRQPDLGTTLTLFLIWLFMLVAANVNFLKLGVMIIAGLMTTPLTWFFLKDYQKVRFLSFLSPSQDPLGVGYNVIQSTIAVGSGQFLGRGLGRGTQSRLQFLPEYRTDFIFASIAEELGFLASVVVLALYGLILARCLKIASLSTSRYGNLVVFGVLGMLFFQIIVNIGMNVGLVPITGITLPLISYGGSSLIATLICLGFVAGVARFSHYRHSSDLN
ncbi:rod shape-determining protein RodA [Candidatus Daviesbacteria bacterium]|nr:rod shape-determining protein RodA [Candidatus Daviesbacteria bacterium]